MRLRPKTDQNCVANIGKAWFRNTMSPLKLKQSLFKKLFISLQLTVGHRGNSSEHARSCRHQLFSLFAVCAEKFTCGEILGGQMKKNVSDGICFPWVTRNVRMSSVVSSGS